MVRKATIKDRRIHPRYLAYLPIEIRRRKSTPQEADEEAYEAFCLDISHGGIRFGTNELFQLRERLELTLYSPDGGPELTCEAEVTRAARVPQHYEIAAKILRVLSPEETPVTRPAISGQA